METSIRKSAANHTVSTMTLMDAILFIFFILIVTTIKPIDKQLNAFRVNWLALTW